MLLDNVKFRFKMWKERNDNLFPNEFNVLRENKMDSRITPAKRTIIIDIEDETPIPFTNKDMEWVGEVIEKALQQRFNVKVINIDMEGN